LVSFLIKHQYMMHNPNWMSSPADSPLSLAMDFDTDSCYNAPAIDSYGNLNFEKSICESPSIIGDCRDRSDLENNNVYSRARCNDGWCAYMYGYYFEKDQIAGCLGHMHDWEHVVVFVYENVPKYVSASAHGRYEMRAWKDLLVDGTHAKIVYHKDGSSTHAFRFAKAEDDLVQENHFGRWFYGDLVGWNGFPSIAVRNKMTAKSWGSTKIDFKDERFRDSLENAIVAQGNTPYVIDMRTDVDNESPGMPDHCPNHFWPLEV
ncbi:necrosis inducing protein, partial [Colletotrichum incanum]